MPFTENPENNLIEVLDTGHLDAVKSILNENKLQINHIFNNHSKRTPLHWVAINKNQEVVPFLLKQEGINAHIKDENDLLPIHFAAIFGNFSNIIALLNFIPAAYRQEIVKEVKLHLKANNFEQLVNDVQLYCDNLSAKQTRYPDPEKSISPNFYSIFKFDFLTNIYSSSSKEDVSRKLKKQ